MINHLRNRYLNSSLSKKIIILITLFITIVPTTLIATLAFAYYKVGIQSLFDEQISKAISQTVEIANRYLKEHKDNIKSDVFVLAKDIEKNYDILVNEPNLFTPFLDKQAELRNLSEVIVFQDDRIIAKNTFSFSFAFERLPLQELLEADNGDVVILNTSSEDKVQAIIKLNHFVQTYLIVGRYVDQSIIDYLKNTQGSALKYEGIKSDLIKTQRKLQITFILSFILLCVISLFLGRKLAVFITRPLNDLVNATKKLKSGDFSYKLPEKQGKDETAILTRAFNQMTETLFEQRSELIKFNKIIDERRRFIEKILSEISAGVMTLNSNNIILLANESAKKILHIKKIPNNTNLKDIFPELLHLVESAVASQKEIIQNNLKIIRENVTFYLFVRISVLWSDINNIETIIITFDDITELLSAQRASAWGDVARRVAHEIKNPLTPITLAAERLKIKYRSQITEGSQNFEKYINTIIKHVEDIQRIVIEFVEFAKTPKPQLGKNNLIKLLTESIFSQKVANPYISYKFINKIGKECIIHCDPTQISQVLMNIIKNSAESIDQKILQSIGKFLGKIIIEISEITEEIALIKIIDNGVGMNANMLEKIFEPYVTTKAKGTGLGLAIVKKIIEDHGGNISLKSIKAGIEVKFTLPIYRNE